MNLDLNETQTIFRDTVRGYLEQNLPFARIRELENSGRHDEVLWSALVEHGWLGIALPEAVGGGGASLVEAGLLTEEVQRRAALVPLLETLTCAATLQRYAEPDRATALLGQILAGQVIPVPALLEASDRFGHVLTSADADGLIRGEKYFVDYAETATHHLVAAEHNGEVGLYLVARSDPALKSEASASLARTPQAVVRYDGAAGERVCGADGAAFLLQLGRALCTIQILGCMQQSLDMTVAYTCVREQFGRPIGTFQAVQHHAANMATQVEATRFLAYEALDALERGRATDARVAIAKAAASQAVPEVTMLGQQLHGGQGFIEENDLYFFTLRGKERSLAWGTLDECLAIIAKTVDTPENWL
jgi:alkylation response protein AidB-like acyl-CoA dehydrogenase